MVAVKIGDEEMLCMKFFELCVNGTSKMFLEKRLHRSNISLFRCMLHYLELCYSVVSKIFLENKLNRSNICNFFGNML